MTSPDDQIPQRLQASHREIRWSLRPKYMAEDVQHRSTRLWRQRRPHGGILPHCDGQGTTPMARQSPTRVHHLLGHIVLTLHDQLPGDLQPTW
jgi:hypothetical protein